MRVEQVLGLSVFLYKILLITTECSIRKYLKGLEAA